MRIPATRNGAFLVLSLGVAAGCGEDRRESDCTVGTAAGCSDGKVCEPTVISRAEDLRGVFRVM